MVSPVAPNPSGSGLEQRAFHLLKDLAAQHRVTMVLASPVPLSAGVDSTVRQYVSTIIDYPTTTVAGALEYLSLAFPFLAWLKPTLAVSWLQANRNASAPKLPDSVALLTVFRIRAHSVAKSLFDVRTAPHQTVLDVDDYESATMLSIARFAFRRRRLRLALRSLMTGIQLFGLERKLLPQYDEITCANPDDLAALSRFAPRKQKLILRPNRVELPANALYPTRTLSQTFTLLYIGTLSYFPNEDAALWIAEEVVPKLREKLGPVPFRVLIAGRDPSERLRAKLSGVKEVMLLGNIDSVENLYAQSEIALVAVRCGGGTKVKLLEAVAHQCPVVATPHSLRGLPFLQPEEVLCAGGASDFASQCVAIYKSPEAAVIMANKAYAKLLEVSWSDVSTSCP